MLLGEAIDGPLQGRTVHPHIEVLLLEAVQLLEEVQKRVEAGAFDEVLLQVEEWPLDLAFGAGAVRPAGARLEPVVAAQLQELRVPAEVDRVGVEHEDRKSVV